MKFDVVLALAMPCFLFALALSYGFFVRTNGKPRFERIDQQGGSVFLGKCIMEMFYWGLQPCAKFLIRRHISPNALSVASLILGFASGCCVALGRFAPAVFFFAVSGLLDVLDGMVARFSGQVSEAGYVLDSQLDRYVEFFFIAGLAVHYRGQLWFQVLALMALLGSYLVSYTTLMARLKAVELPPGSVLMRRTERLVYLIGGAYLSVLSTQWWEGGGAGGFDPASEGRAHGYPMIAALVVVAIFSNLSAVQQLLRMLRVLEIRAERVAAAKAIKSDSAA